MATDDNPTLEGIVVDASHDIYKVKLTVPGVSSEHFVKCHLSGKLRKNNILILEGDRVVIRVGSYDLSNGIIVYRR